MFDSLPQHSREMWLYSWQVHFPSMCVGASYDPIHTPERPELGYRRRPSIMFRHKVPHAHPDLPNVALFAILPGDRTPRIQSWIAVVSVPLRSPLFGVFPPRLPIALGSPDSIGSSHECWIAGFLCKSKIGNLFRMRR